MPRLFKVLPWELLPAGLPPAVALDAGFDALETRVASASTAIPIASLDAPATAAALRLAAQAGIGALRIRPVYQRSYQASWDQLTAQVRELLPHAEVARVVLTIEAPAPRFLLSPLEAAAFLDQFSNAWVGVHVHLPAVVELGYPRDWISTLGPRVRRLTLPRFDEPDAGFTDIAAALEAAGYRGFATISADPPADLAGLRALAQMTDRALSTKASAPPASRVP